MNSVQLIALCPLAGIMSDSQQMFNKYVTEPMSFLLGPELANNASQEKSFKMLLGHVTAFSSSNMLKKL